jgi:hypothetical protein
MHALQASKNIYYAFFYDFQASLNHRANAALV